MQDIHWSMGLMGYFPTYTLGNLYAAQFMAKARKDLSDFDERIASGHLEDLTRWLRERIHQHGMTWKAEDLVRQVTGAPLDAGHFINYLQGKYGEIYDF